MQSLTGNTQFVLPPSLRLTSPPYYHYLPSSLSRYTGLLDILGTIQAIFSAWNSLDISIIFFQVSSQKRSFFQTSSEKKSSLTTQYGITHSSLSSSSISFYSESVSFHNTYYHLTCCMFVSLNFLCPHSKLLAS